MRKLTHLSADMNMLAVRGALFVTPQGWKLLREMIMLKAFKASFATPSALRPRAPPHSDPDHPLLHPPPARKPCPPRTAGSKVAAIQKVLGQPVAVVEYSSTRLLGPRVLEGALTPVKEGVRVGIQPMYSVCTGNASCDQCKR